MLIPIGHEKSETRRWPWVSIAIAALCIVVFFFTSQMEKTAEAEAAERAAQVCGYYWERGYLELDKELVMHCDPLAYMREQAKGDNSAVGAIFRQVAEQLEDPSKEDAERDLSPERVRREQESLDQLTEAWRKARDGVPARSFGLVPADTKVHTLVTSIFLHAGLMHLIGNLIFFWLSGPALEDVWGRPLFGVFFVVGGVVANLFWIAKYPESYIPLVGASGAIAALMGAFMVRYWSIKVKIFYFFWFGFRIFTGTFLTPAWLLLGLWLLRELFSAAAFGALFGGTAYLVHVAGFGFGAAVAGSIKWFSIEDRILKPKISVALGEETNEAVEKAHQLRQAGKPEEAWKVLAEEIRQRPSNQDAVLAFWDVGRELGRTQLVAKPFLKLVRHELRDGDALLGLQYWDELVEHLPDTPLDLDLRTRLADGLLAAERDEEAAALLAQVHEDLNPELPLSALIRLTRAAATARSASSIPLLETILGRPSLPDAIRDEMTQHLEDVREMGIRTPRAPDDPEAPLPFHDDSPPLELVIERPRSVGAPPLDVVEAPPSAVPAAQALPLAAAPPPLPQTVVATPPPLPQTVAATPPPLPAAVQAVPPPLPAAVAAVPPPLPAAPDAGACKRLHVMSAVPRQVTAQKISVELTGKGVKVMPLSKVQALAAAVIHDGPASKPYLVIDLLVDSPWEDRQDVRTIRLSSRQFDPRTFVPAEANPKQALLGLIENLLTASGATPLPNPQAVRGKPFAQYPSLGDYESRVLGVRSAA